MLDATASRIANASKFGFVVFMGFSFWNSNSCQLNLFSFVFLKSKSSRQRIIQTQYGVRRVFWTGDGRFVSLRGEKGPLPPKAPSITKDSGRNNLLIIIKTPDCKQNP